MREFIRRHPWRLEIVPLAVVACAFALPLIFRQDMLARMHPWHGYNVEQTWLLRYALRGVWVLAMWVMNLQSNDIWIRHEREKRFDWWTVSGTAWIALSGWWMSGWFFSVAWIAIMVLSPVLEALIERSREFTAHDITSERIPLLSVKPGEPFYYREERNLLGANMAQALLLFCMFPGIWTISGDSSVFFMGAACSIAMILTLRIIFSVSNVRVTARVGIRKVSIPISMVRDCAVYDYNPLVGRHHGWVTTYDGMKMFSPNLGPCLRIETSDGKAYLLGVKDPEAVCELIHAAVADTGSSRTR